MDRTLYWTMEFPDGTERRVSCEEVERRGLEIDFHPGWARFALGDIPVYNVRRTIRVWNHLIDSIP